MNIPTQPALDSDRGTEMAWGNRKEYKMKQAFESRLNIALSELLNQAGIGSRPEYKDVGRKNEV